MRGIQVGDLVELTSEATFSRGGLRRFTKGGEIIGMKAEVIGLEGTKYRVRRDEAVLMKWGSFPLIEVIGDDEIEGVVERVEEVQRGDGEASEFEFGKGGYERFWETE